MPTPITKDTELVPVSRNDRDRVLATTSFYLPAQELNLDIPDIYYTETLPIMAYGRELESSLILRLETGSPITLADRFKIHEIMARMMHVQTLGTIVHQRANTIPFILTFHAFHRETGLPVNFQAAITSSNKTSHLIAGLVKEWMRSGFNPYDPTFTTLKALPAEPLEDLDNPGQAISSPVFHSEKCYTFSSYLDETLSAYLENNTSPNSPYNSFLGIDGVTAHSLAWSLNVDKRKDPDQTADDFIDELRKRRVPLSSIGAARLGLMSATSYRCDSRDEPYFIKNTLRQTEIWKTPSGDRVVSALELPPDHPFLAESCSESMGSWEDPATQCVYYPTGTVPLSIKNLKSWHYLKDAMFHFPNLQFDPFMQASPEELEKASEAYSRFRPVNSESDSVRAAVENLDDDADGDNTDPTV